VKLRGTEIFMSRYQRVGDWLIERGIISAEQCSHALEVHRTTGGRFGEVLISLGYCSEQQVVECLAQQYDIPVCDLANVKPSEAALKLVSPTFALSRLILPISVTQTEFHCALCDPLDIQGTDYLTRALNKRLVISLAGHQQIFEAIAKHYALPTAKKQSPILVETATEKKKTKRSTKPRAAGKVDEQPDRRELLLAIAGGGQDSLWDAYQD